jgi:D-sedoheptulose 7-phosphate isomerase
MKNLILDHINQHESTLNTLKLDENLNQITKIANLLINCLKNDGTIFFCGNGGSASDSQHLAAELVGRYKNNRRPLKSIALNNDSAVMTCIANDFGYENIFSRQINGLASKKDILFIISTSGNSKNINNAIDAAKEMGLLTIGLLGKSGGDSAKIVDSSIIIDSDITARIQEMHIMIGHMLCDLIETGLNLKE